MDRGRILNRIVISLGVMITVACADSQSGNPSTLRLYYQGNETVFSPADHVSFRQLVFATLLRRGSDGTEGWLVDEWSPSADSRTWTYHIRENAFWHDGVPVTTADIAFSLDLLNNPPVRDSTERPFDLEVLDDKTFSLRYDDAHTKEDFEFDVICFPKHRLEMLDRDEFWFWDFWKQPIGNGPFHYVRHEPDIMTELAADPAYFLEGPGVDTLRIRFGGDPVVELLAGNVDVHVWASEGDIPKFRRSPELRHVLYGGATSILYWNHDHPFFRESQARRALTMAIDRASLLPPVDPDDVLPILDAPVDFTRHAPSSAPIPFAPDSATRLLHDLGWREEDDDGILERSGSEFRFELLVHSEDQMHDAVIVQAALRRIGVAVDITTIERLMVKSRVMDGNFEAAISFGRYWVDFILGGVPQGEYPPSRSPLGYDFEDLYTAMAAYLQDFGDDAEERFETNLWEIFQRDMPATVLKPHPSVLVFHERVRGLSPFLGFAFMDRVWTEQDLSGVSPSLRNP